MPRLQYPFYQFRDAEGELSPDFRLYLPICLSNPETGQSIEVFGQVDTGADSSLFPAYLAQFLGHHLKGDGVKRSTAVGIESDGVAVWRHTFDVGLLDTEHDRIVRSFPSMEIGCIESECPILLGAADFLRYFNWQIGYDAHLLDVQW